MATPVDAFKEDRQHVEFRQQVAGKIENPLLGISREQLRRDVEVFAREKGLEEHLPVLQKGAILAQNPLDYDMLPELTAEDRTAIRWEHEHKWSHPWTLYLTIILCSMGACVQGWDQTGSNAANLSFPQAFGIAEIAGTANYQRNTWLVGLINSAPYLGSAFVGCWLSAPLNNYAGRRGTIFITALILIITPICSGLTQTWEQLFVVRLLLGFGMGAKGSTVPIFAAENAPTQIRGALVMGWQLWTACGIFLGYVANVAVADTGKISWRLQLGSAFIPAVPLACGILFCPESPRWLMGKNRYPAAYRSLLRLRHHELQAARDIYYVHVQLEAEMALKAGGNYFTRFRDLFTIPRIRRATLASRQVFAFPAVFTIDTFGRSIRSAKGLYHSAEVFPLSHREAGMGWAVATCLFWAAILSMTFPSMLAAMSPTGAFCFYAGLNVIAFCLLFLFLPETKQRTLEELDQVFSVPTSRFMSYQVKETLPYWIKRYVFFKKEAVLEPLFIVEGVDDPHAVRGNRRFADDRVDEVDEKKA
ncbi:hypothetical protein RQP46_002929 [Phenoliferia psychrophenolica]